jgi:hypothetical protein
LDEYSFFLGDEEAEQEKDLVALYGETVSEEIEGKYA